MLTTPIPSICSDIWDGPFVSLPLFYEAGGEKQKDRPCASREGFSIREISDDLFERMRGGNTYKEDCIVPREDLRYMMVLHKDNDGNIHQGEMVVHKLIAEDVLEIFEKLYDAGYPIERMVLPDNYMADDETKSAAANGNEYGICVEL